MAKPQSKKPRKAQTKKPRTSEAELPDDMYDEVDAFHRQKDKIMLNGDGAASEDDSEEDLGVYDMADDSEDEDDNRLEQLEQQEKRLRAKLQLQKGEDSEEDEDESEEEDVPAGKWGRAKSAYYEAGENEDEEDIAEEEAEAIRLQNLAAQKLSNRDFGLASSDEEDDDDAQEDDEDVDTLERQVEREELRPKPQNNTEATMAADDEEFEALLTTFKTALQEVRNRVGPLLKEVKEGQLATADGLSYLETKSHLLLQYIMHLVFYFLLRAEGKSAKAHPVISRLVEIRLYLDKIRPIDKKLQYQVNKLLTSQQLVQANVDSLEEAEMDPLQFRANPQALVPKVTAEEAQDGDTGGVYRPPMLNPVAMEDDPDKDTNRRKRRAAEERARRSARNQMISDLAREVVDAPDEIREAQVEGDNSYAARQREKLLRRAAEEEELMMRVPLAKKELKGLRAVQHKAGFSGGAMLDDFADDVADLVQATSQMEGGGRLSQKFGADLSHQNATRASGDADLPDRAPLATRRAKLDNAKAQKKRPMLDSDEEPDEVPLLPKSKKSKKSSEPNQLYDEVAKNVESKRAAKLAKYKAPPSAVPLEDELEEGHRKLSKAVEKNRGLTPHRRKDAKNPRVKGRKKFEKANIRRKGQVQAPRTQAGPYGGEQTGIKAGISKSTRL